MMDMEEAKIEVEDFFNTIQGRRRFNISGNPIVSKIEVSYVDPKVPAKGLQFMPFRSYRGEDIEIVNRPFNINNAKDLEFFENLLKPLGSDVITVDDNLPTLKMEQARKGKKGDQFILRSNGKKYTLVEDQNGNLFGTTTPEKYT